ncbi:MAG: hypothetical protein ACRD4O_10080, partial [Bryobacteraceae bacterium]
MSCPLSGFWGKDDAVGCGGGEGIGVIDLGIQECLIIEFGLGEPNDELVALLALALVLRLVAGALRSLSLAVLMDLRSLTLAAQLLL